MQIRDALAADLPEELRGRLWGLMEEAWQAVVSGQLTPAEAEERVVELSRQMGGELLAVGLAERHGKQTGPHRACGCGHRQRFEGYRECWIITRLGEGRYRRAYYRCPQCKATYYAGDEALGITDTHYTLPAQEAVSLACSGLPFAEAQTVLEGLSGLWVSVSHLQRLSERHGERAEARLGQERQALLAGQLDYLPERAPGRLYVTLDATKTPFVDAWHETRVGAVYEVEPDEEGMDQACRTTYVSGVQEPVSAFGERLYQEARRRGVAQAREVVVVADGAPWIWNLAAEHFPQRLEILDFYHAAKRLHSVADAVYGEGSSPAQRWARANTARLLGGRADNVLCSLRRLRPKTKEGQEAVRLAIQYFIDNRQRMHYAQYQAHGYHIGSGIVEAGCKCVVGTRCKRSGMRWTKRGAQHILALRCLLLSNRWDEYWQPLKQAA